MSRTTPRTINHTPHPKAKLGVTRKHPRQYGGHEPWRSATLDFLACVIGFAPWIWAGHELAKVL